MAANGASMITSVLEHLKMEDIQLLLENRGLPSIGDKQSLTERLQGALCEEICEFEWEQGEVPACHAEIIGAGSTMCTHHNSVYVFGGMDDERSEHMSMWKWDLSKDEGFEPVTYRGVVPAKLTAGHYAAVYGNELWVFPGPRNHNMRRVYCLDMLRYRWAERTVVGDPPSDTHCRRNLNAMLDGRRLVVLGGPNMDKVFFFEFESRTWSARPCKDVLPSWSFGHATKRGRSIFALGSPRGETGTLEVRELDLATLRWRRVDAKGTPPCFRIHSSAAVVGDKWIVHGGRRPGKFNVTNQTFVYSFTTNRWSVLMAEGDTPVAREWQAALGLQDCMVVVGGRADIPDFEPIPLSCDTMSSAVEILWYRAPPQPQAPTGKAALLGSVRGLCGSEHLADVSLIVCGRHMPAHRHVLAPHSRVFERMWSNSMSEMETAEVTITDLSPETVELLLQYCYGCLLEMPTDHAEVIDLFKAADKYDVLGLVQECVASFRQLTGADEVAPLLQVAAERHSDELRAVCVDVAAQCLPDVLETESFRDLIAHQPDLGLEFIRETALRLGCPCAPTTPAQPGSESSSDSAAPREFHSPAALPLPAASAAGQKSPPSAPALPLAAAAAAAAVEGGDPSSEAESSTSSSSGSGGGGGGGGASSSGGEEVGTPRARGLVEGPTTPPSRGRGAHGPLPPQSPVPSPSGSGSTSGLAIEVPRDNGLPLCSHP